MAHQQDPILNTGTSYQGSTSTAASSASYPPGTSSDDIRRDIDRTRANMDQTVDRLGQRLAPRHILDEVVDYFSSWRNFSSGGSSSSSPGSAGASTSDLASSAGQSLREGAMSVVDRVKDHPLPALLIGAGVAWLLLEGDKPRTRVEEWKRSGRQGDIGHWRDLPEHSGSVVDARTGEPYDASYGSEYHGQTASTPGEPGSSSSSGPGVVERAKEVVGSAASAVGSAAKSVGYTIAGAGTGVASGASSAVSGVGAAGSTVGRYAGQGYRSASGGITDAIEDYPLISGVAALALGAVAGLLLPGTRREDQLVGEYAEQVKGQASDYGQKLYEQGKTAATEVANAAASAAGDEASAKDANPDSLVEKFKNVVHDVTKVASESARREGVHPEQLTEKVSDIATKAKDAGRAEVERKKDETMR